MPHSPGTDVYYNGVVLRNVLTREWNEEHVYDPSGTDLIGQKYTMKFEGILHVQTVADRGTTTPNIFEGKVEDDGQPLKAKSAPASLQDIKGLLSEPRKQLIVMMNSKRVLICKPTEMATDLKDLDRDTDNGPKPVSVTITRAVSDKSVRVVFAISCVKLANKGQYNFPESPVINNRWSIQEVMDDNFFTTRVIKGRLRLSASLAEKEGGQQTNKPFAYRVAHYWKFMTLPALENGFKRERIDFAVAENGLDCDYIVTDRQVHTAAPWPATKMQATHTERTANGVHFFADVNVRLEGPPHIDKRALIERAVQICDAKLGFRAMKYNQDYFLEDSSITDHIGEVNTVEMRMRIRRVPPETPGGITELLTNIRKKYLGLPLALPPMLYQYNSVNSGAYDPRVSAAPAEYGYDPHGAVRSPAALFALHCYLQTPWSPPHAIPTSRKDVDAGYDGTRTAQYVAVQQFAYSAAVSGKGGQFSEEARKSVFSYARAESTYFHPQCRVQLPIARQTSGSASEEDDDTSFVTRLARPQCRREIKVEAERVGDKKDEKKRWPPMPKPLDSYTDGKLKGTLLKHHVTLLPPSLSADGEQQIYRAIGYYLYAMNRPPRGDEAIQVGVLPFTSLDPKDTTFKGDAVYTVTRLNPGGK
jgi:hypothetical protein